MADTLSGQTFSSQRAQYFVSGVGGDQNKQSEYWAQPRLQINANIALFQLYKVKKKINEL